MVSNRSAGGATGGYCDAGFVIQPALKQQLLLRGTFGVKLAVIADLPCLRFREHCFITMKTVGCDWKRKLCIESEGCFFRSSCRLSALIINYCCCQKISLKKLSFGLTPTISLNEVTKRFPLTTSILSSPTW